MRVAKREDANWFKEAKLGLFFTWDLGDVLGEDDHGDQWGQTPFSEFKSLINGFTAEYFDTDEFTGKLKEWGFRYVIPTTKHGDGLCFWDSKNTSFTTVNSPAKRDFMLEWRNACDKHGLKLGAYFCGSDWSHPYAEALFKPDDRYRHDKIDLYYDEHDPEADKKVGAFADMMFAQVREILTNYGEIFCMWWDATPRNSPAFDVEAIRQMVYELQPGIIQNTRIEYHAPNLEEWGDIATPEQNIPPFPLTYRGLPVPWETSYCSTNNWMYEKSDQNFKSARTLLRSLAEVASKGGNLIINVSPDGKGRIPQEIITSFEEMGAWIKVNAESIWDTTAGPRWDIPNVALTSKGNTLYVHYFGDDPVLLLPNFVAKPVHAHFLAGGANVPVSTDGKTITLDLQTSPNDPLDNVIVLEFDGVPANSDYPPIFPDDAILTAKKTRGLPSEADWQAANWRTLTSENGVGIFVRQSPPDELTVRFAALNDEENLYVRAIVDQSNLRVDKETFKSHYDGFAESQGAKKNENLSHKTSLEFYFDAYPPSPEVTVDGRSFQIVAAADGGWAIAFADKEETLGCDVKITRTENGYDITCTVPLKSLFKDLGRTPYEYDLTNYFGLPPMTLPVSANTAPVLPGDEIGFNLGVNAVFPTGGLRDFRQKLWWQARACNPWNDPHQWGRLRLAK